LSGLRRFPIDALHDVFFKPYEGPDALIITPAGTIVASPRCRPSLEDAMQTFVGMILGVLLLVGCVYVYDSIQTSSATSGQVAQANRTIVNWDVAAADWKALKTRAHDDWIRISSK
jgi:hypothetical protein